MPPGYATAKSWSASKQQLQRINVCHKTTLRKMIRKGLQQTSGYKYIITNKTLRSICKTSTNILDFTRLQQTKDLAHHHTTRRGGNQTNYIGKFCQKKEGRPSNTLKDNVGDHHNLDIKQFSKKVLYCQF